MGKVEELIKKEIELAKEKLKEIEAKKKDLKLYIKAREKFCKTIERTESKQGGNQDAGQQQ